MTRSNSSSEVLIVSSHHQPEMAGWNIQRAKDLESATLQVRQSTFMTIAIECDDVDIQSIKQFCQELKRQSPLTQVIIALSAKSEKRWPILATLVNSGRVAAIVSDFNDNHFVQALIQAKEAGGQLQIEEQTLTLMDEQNSQLLISQQEYESTISKRKLKTDNAHKRLLQINKKIEALHKVLTAIHQAPSVGGIESVLNELLVEPYNLSWIKIELGPQMFFTIAAERITGYEFLRIPFLPHENASEETGTLVLAREMGREFSRDEREVFYQIAESAALAIDRLTKLEFAESLKEQWEATFDAISSAICLTDMNFHIVRTNLAFSQQSGQSFRSLIGKNCFETFLGDTMGEELPEAFQIQKSKTDPNGNRQFEISGQVLSLQQGIPIRLIFFRDTTEERRLERQALETARLAELGTIGSSIAHELNNPLGGIISFLQLIKMDLEANSPHKEDIQEMEAAAQRCKEIVENLLGFCRLPDPSDKQNLDLSELIKKSFKLVEIQTRSLGIELHLSDQPTIARIEGHENLLLQAIKNLLQKSIASVQLKEGSGSRDAGRIDVRLTKKENSVEVNISDNGLGWPDTGFNPTLSTSGLSLTVAQKILRDHQAVLEIDSQPNIGTRAKISFPRV